MHHFFVIGLYGGAWSIPFDKAGKFMIKNLRQINMSVKILGICGSFLFYYIL